MHHLLAITEVFNIKLSIKYNFAKPQIYEEELNRRRKLNLMVTEQSDSLLVNEPHMCITRIVTLVSLWLVT